jgi:drug/metabolite transporter (DMT)-like permease
MGYSMDVAVFDYQMNVWEIIGAVIIVGGSAMIFALKYF